MIESLAGDAGDAPVEIATGVVGGQRESRGGGAGGGDGADCADGAAWANEASGPRNAESCPPCVACAGAAGGAVGGGDVGGEDAGGGTARRRGFSSAVAFVFADSATGACGAVCGAGTVARVETEVADDSPLASNVGSLEPPKLLAGVESSGGVIITMLPHFGQATIWPINDLSRTLSRALQVVQDT